MLNPDGMQRERLEEEAHLLARDEAGWDRDPFRGEAHLHVGVVEDVVLLAAIGEDRARRTVLEELLPARGAHEHLQLVRR